MCVCVCVCVTFTHNISCTYIHVCTYVYLHINDRWSYACIHYLHVISHITYVLSTIETRHIFV